MRASRAGFTLVELLVAMALIIFIMAILSEAFVAATKTFRDLKALGDMAERLRTASNVLRRYLAADHFEGRRRLSDANFWVNGPPQEGFFRVYQGTAATAAPPPPLPSPLVASTNYNEGTDPDASQPSFITTNMALHFTAKLRGNTRNDFFMASVPTGSILLTNTFLGPSDSRYQDTTSPNPSYNAQWAEVAFFLRALPDTANGNPLYALYMRQRSAVPDNGGQIIETTTTLPGPPALSATSYEEVSGVFMQTAAGPPVANSYFFNSPRDLTIPARRFGMAITDPSGKTFSSALGTYTTFVDDGLTGTAQSGSDLLLSDVISFDVRLLAAGQADFLDVMGLTTAFGAAGASSNPSFSTTGPMVFDTWSAVKDDVPFPGQPAPTQTYDYTAWATAGTTSSMPIWNGSTGPIIKAIQIIIRVWDFKTEQTRQVTLVVPL
jgi:prepilin-type N-terminal cleavage/methylation domain-containing protein